MEISKTAVPKLEAPSVDRILAWAELSMLLLSIVFGRDFVSMFSGSSGAVPPANQASRSAVQDPAEAKLVQFVSFVLDDAQQTWERVLPQ